MPDELRVARRRRVQVQPVCQISDAHCGPAVVEMLLAAQGISATQQQIAEFAGVLVTIDEQGVRPDQLGRAARRAAPHLRFWYKREATLEDLLRIVVDYRCPAGVEWQGLFEPENDRLGQEDADYGHYSIVSGADRRRRILRIVDPYRDWYLQERIFTFAEFLPRWYDFNEVVDPDTGRAELVEDYHLLFVIVPQRARFPQAAGMAEVV